MSSIQLYTRTQASDLGNEIHKVSWPMDSAARTGSSRVRAMRSSCGLGRQTCNRRRGRREWHVDCRSSSGKVIHIGQFEPVYGHRINATVQV